MAKEQGKRRDKAKRRNVAFVLLSMLFARRLTRGKGRCLAGPCLFLKSAPCLGEFWRLFSEVVNDYFFANSLEDFFDELDVQRMNLVVVLDFFVGKDNVEGDLVALIDDGSFAGGHFAGVEVEGSWNGFQVLGDAVQQFLRGIGLFWIGPKDDDVREHRWKFQPRRVV